MKVRKLSIYLCVLMLVLSCPFEAVFAGTADGSDDRGGMTDTLAWSKSNGKLQIYGSGQMPDYEYGEAPWISKNTLATPQDLFATAEKEMGYHEKRSSRNLYEKNENNGEDEANYTKYAYELSKIKGSGIFNPAQWCNIFVDWCMNYTFGTARAKSLICGGFTGYTPTSSSYYKRKGQWNTWPKVGDQAFFKDDVRICHTGIVVKVTEDRLYTIEGNATDRVRKRTYLFGDPYIAGFGQPVYDGNSDLREIESVQFENGIQNVGNWAFPFCTGIHEVQLPENLQTIGDYAFYNCQNLQTVEIPEGVNRIGAAAFQNCAIWSLDLPSSLTSLGEGAFYGCSNVSDLILPSGVSSIEEYTFMGCSGLQYISIPSSVTNIKMSAFGGCDRLTDIHYEGTPEQWNSIVIEAEDNRDVIRYDISNIQVHFNSIIVDGFRDVFSDHWFADSVDSVYHKNLMKGTDADRFTPEGTTDRAMLVTILYRMAGSPDVQADLEALTEQAERKAAAEEEEKQTETQVSETEIPVDQEQQEVTNTEEESTESGEDRENSDIQGAEVMDTPGVSDDQETGKEAEVEDVIENNQVVENDENQETTEDKAGASQQETVIDVPKLPNFQDVPEDAYYTDAVRWAYLHNLVTGYDEVTFAPNDPITREQVAVILRNYAEMTGLDVTAKNLLSHFEDYSNIHYWALDAMAWANQVQLIRGISENELDPGNHATRAQIAAIIDRFDEMLKEAI